LGDFIKILDDLYLEAGHRSRSVKAWPSVDEKDQRKALADKIKPLQSIYNGRGDNPNPISAFLTFFRNPNKYTNQWS